MTNPFALCQIGRCFDPLHPTCASCRIGCALKSSSTPTLPAKAGESLAKKPKERREPNKTEQAAYFYLKMCYPDANIRYEAITFHLEQGAAYTPDYLVTTQEGMTCVEIKNAAYKHASYGRSRMAFRQAALEFPTFQFIWLELQNGEWILN